MKINGSFTIPADQETVYHTFTDAEKITTCVPGVENLRVLGTNEYEADMVVKVQFMTIKFKVSGELIETVKGQALLIKMTGQPMKLAGLFQNQLTAQFKELEPGQTEVSYEMEVQMSGRLASLGEIIIKSTIEKQAKIFAQNVNDLFKQ